MAKRPYSTQYTARANPRRYLLSGIPPTLWEKVRRQAKKENIAVRSLILQLLESWLAYTDQRAAMQRASARSAEIDQEYAEGKRTED